MAECTIYDKLRYIAETKDLIKAAIEAQDVKVLESATFRQYAEYITQIRKVSSVNGMQGDVTITAEDLGALTEIPSEYITETELNEKGYLTAVPDVYITEDELSSQLADKVSQNGLNEAIEGVRNDIPTNVSQLTNDSGYITLNEVPKVDLSGYALKSEIPDISVKQDKLTAGNGISITDNVISLDYEYDLFEVVPSLPTENISDNKVYLLLDSNGSEGNTYVEYLYVNGQWEELGKFKVNIDLSGYATEDWVNSQGFLKEHQDISNLATKQELATKQDVISDLDTIRSGAAKGATALQSVPSGYATEQWVNEQGFLKEHQDISNLATKEELNTKQDTISDLETIRSGAAKGATALQSVPSTYALKTDILSAKTDSRYTTYDVQNPVLSGKTILLQNEVTDSRKYHTLGYDKTITTSVPVQKYINITRNYNGVPSMDTDIESGINFSVDSDGVGNMSSQITFTLDKIKNATNLMHYEVTYPARDSEGNVTGGGEQVVADVTYDPNTKLLSVPEGGFGFAQIKRSDTLHYLFGGGTDGNEYLENGRWYYNFEQGPLQEGATLTWYVSCNIPHQYWEYSVTINNMFYEESSVTTDDKPERLNDYIRYANNVKAYILTDKNTTFKTINGEQITGNGDITIDTNVDLTPYATKEELNTKQDTITDLEAIRSGAAKGATALQSVPNTYALKSDILSAKTDERYTDYDVQNPVLSGNTIVLQNEVTDSRNYHTLGYDKIATTIGFGNLTKRVVMNSDGSVTSDFDDYTNVPIDFSNITDDGDVIIINYVGTYANHNDDGTTYEGDAFNEYITYNKQTKILKYSERQPSFAFAQFSRSDNGENVLFPNSIEYDCSQLPEGVHLIWNIYVSSGFFYTYTAETQGNLFVGETTVNENTSSMPERKNEYFRYENNVKAYILTDKNTTFKTINGQQITGNGDITIDTNVDLSGYATKEELNAKQDVINDLETIRSGASLGATALQSVPEEYAKKTDIPDLAPYATKEELNTKQDTITDLDSIRSGASLGATALQSVPSGYATEQWVNEQGFLKEHQDISNLATKEELNAKQDTINDLETIRSGAALGATALQSVPDTYAKKTDIPDISTKQDVIPDLEAIRSGAAKGETALQSVPNTYALKSEIPDISVKQDKLTAGNGISITDNVISLDYEYDLFEVVPSLPTENISDNKIYLVYQSDGDVNNLYIEYIYAAGHWEELGKFKANVDLSGYATEEWVNSQGFLKEHQDISNLATKQELATKQDVISDLDTIRSGAAKGATALQSVPEEYAKKTDIPDISTKQDVIPDLETIRSGAALGATALQSVPNTYALKSEIPDISTKQDTLVSGTNIKTINGNSLLGSGDITIEGGSGNVDLTDYYTKSETNALVNPKLQQVTLTQAEYDALSTKEDNVLYIISDAEDLKFKTINGQQITGEGNIEIEASADNVPTVQTTPDGTTSNYIYSTISHTNPQYSVISDISDFITYSTDKASIKTWKRYWGEESSHSHQSWSIEGATTSQAGLMSASDKSKLDGIDLTPYATKTELNTKQDTLVSGTNIKTINGISLLGEGDITVSGEGVVDLSGYYTKAEIDEMIGGASNTITEINNLVV